MLAVLNEAEAMGLHGKEGSNGIVQQWELVVQSCTPVLNAAGTLQSTNPKFASKVRNSCSVLIEMYAQSLLPDAITGGGAHAVMEKWVWTSPEEE